MGQILEIAEDLWLGRSNTYQHHPFHLPYGMEKLASGTWMYKGFANTIVRETDDGLILIDPGGIFDMNLKYKAIREFTSQRLNTAIFTHGHMDHVFGVDRFEKEAKKNHWETPKIIAHENVIPRFERYNLTNGWNGHINNTQFMGGAAEGYFPTDFCIPKTLISKITSIRVGNIEATLFPGRGETDDAVWVFFPDIRLICAGDFFIWGIPNAGNPQKVQRYALDWSMALRAMADFHPMIFIPGHGWPILGENRIQQVLLDTAKYLESIHGQTISFMNEGNALDETVRKVKVPAELSNRAYLQPIYDEPEFIIRNIWRLYGGWYDGHPANLKPASESEKALEIAHLAGGAEKLAQRAGELMLEGNPRLACHFAEWAVLSEPQNKSIREIAARIFETRAYSETSTMAIGIYLTAARQLGGKLSKKEPTGIIFELQEMLWKEKNQKK
jgi:alkyl sulfatase BDS1-like metallo-beta-lactamase superfamily hydrolase